MKQMIKTVLVLLFLYVYAVDASYEALASEQDSTTTSQPAATPSSTPSNQAKPIKPRTAIKINTDFSPDWTAARMKPGHSAHSSAAPTNTANDPGQTYRSPEPIAEPPVDDNDGVVHRDMSVLAQECFHSTDNTYTYSVCPFRNVTQKNNFNDNVVVLGIWKEWAVSSSGHLGMKYTDGKRCGPKYREMTVWVSCQTNDAEFKHDMLVADDVMRVHTALMAVTEPSTCSYEITMTLPVISGMCDPTGDKRRNYVKSLPKSLRRQHPGWNDEGDFDGHSKANGEKKEEAPSTPSADSTSKAAATTTTASKGWESVPTSMERCRKQHAFLISTVSSLHGCLMLLWNYASSPDRSLLYNDVPAHCRKYLDNDKYGKLGRLTTKKKQSKSSTTAETPTPTDTASSPTTPDSVVDSLSPQDIISRLTDNEDLNTVPTSQDSQSNPDKPEGQVNMLGLKVEDPMIRKKTQHELDAEQTAPNERGNTGNDGETVTILLQQEQSQQLQQPPEK